MNLIAQHDGRQEHNVSSEFSVVSQCSLRGRIRSTGPQWRYRGRPSDGSGTLLAFAVAHDGPGGFVAEELRFSSKYSVYQSDTGLL
jgi:hypothetical protein